MSDIDKALFKAKLELEIITPEEIQQWASTTLEKDSSNNLALDICFLSTPEQVVAYFKQLSQTIFTTDTAKHIVNQIMLRYIEKNLNLISQQDTRSSFIQNLLYFSQTLENEELFDFFNYYDDQFYLSSQGYIQAYPDQVLQEFIHDVKDLLSKSNKETLPKHDNN